MSTNLTSFKINLFSNQKIQLSKKYFSKIREKLLRKKSVQILDIFFFNCIDILDVKEFIECGAREASASKRLSKKGVKAIAIEANPITFNKLTLPDSNKVLCFNVGVGDSEEEISFYIPTNDLMAGHATFQPKEFDNYENKKIKVKKLDDLLNDCKFGSHPGALWIDVEGYQRQVLDGSKNYMKNPNLLIVKIELEQNPVFKGQSTSEIIDDKFKSFGFELIFCDDQGGYQFNAVYIRKTSIDLIAQNLEKEVLELNRYNPNLIKILNIFFKKQTLLSFFKKKAITIFGEKNGNKLCAFLGSKVSQQKEEN